MNARTSPLGKTTRWRCFSARAVLLVLGTSLASILIGQAITEFPIPTAAGGPESIAAGPDGNVWFTEGNSNKIGRITPSGAITEFPLSSPYRIQCITPGPDGNLWFTLTDTTNGQIGKITPAGTITLFSTAIPSRLYSITAGLDGALWFTETASNISKIGRITTTGDVTEFPIPTPNGSFGVTHSITKGPSLLPFPATSLFFTEQDGNKIGRVTTAGAVTNEYLIPTASSSPIAITRGPDGADWFTEENANKIGRVTSGGFITEFPAFSPRDITTGSDGALWFTEASGDGIGRITTAGLVSYDLVPTPASETFGIASGPDGNIWFTEYSGNKIGRVLPPTGCGPGGNTLSLNGGRFTVAVCWSVPSQGRSGNATGVSLSEDTGYFWFFNSANIELVIKVLDGRAVNGHFWVFYGALSEVQYTVTVTDTQTGAVQTYTNPSGTLASVADTRAFSQAVTGLEGVATAPEAASIGEIETRSAAELYGLYEVLAEGQTVEPSPASLCTAGLATLCLNQARFQVNVDWEAPSQGQSGQGMAIPITGDTGYFWFFSSTNVELMVKVLDGRSINGHFWVFYGALSDVQYTVTVTDTQTGAVQTYTNPSGTLASVADTSAF